MAKLVGSYENSVDSIQDVSPSSSNLTAPSYSPLSELAGMSSNENGSSEETPCSKDCTSSSTDNASSNDEDDSVVPLDFYAQAPLTASLISSTSHTSSFSPDWIPPTPTALLDLPVPSPPSAPSPTSAQPALPPPALPPWDGFKLVGDNIDKNIRPSDQRFHRQTRSLHYFHLYAVRDRVNFSNTTDVANTTKIIDPKTLVVSQAEWGIFKNHCEVLISR